jgi:uncharacterized protein
VAADIPSAETGKDGGMLSPDSPATQWVLGLVALALVVLLAIRAIRKDRTEYQQFKLFTDSGQRQRMLRRWLLASFATFGGASVLILLLTWQFVPLFLRAVNRWGVTRNLRSWFSDNYEVAGGVIIGFVIAFLALTAVAIVAARREKEVPTIGDIRAILPRNRQELVIAAVISINAGVVEELLMRLALPALLFGATGSAIIAVAASILFFGLLHVYQGPLGILGTTIVGAIMMALYLLTGNILVPIVVHALIDLRSLVLIPVLVYRVHTKSATSEAREEDPTSAI